MSGKRTYACVECGDSAAVDGVFCNACGLEPGDRRHYPTLDSGQRQEFTTGARRDVQTGKGRYDLLPREPVHRWTQLLERGAEKYGEHNWRKGIPLSRFLSSGLRHFFQLLDGREDEDHAAAILFNIAGFMQTLKDIEDGLLPRELDDRRNPRGSVLAEP